MSSLHLSSSSSSPARRISLPRPNCQKTPTTNGHLKLQTLLDTFLVHVHKAETRPLDVPLVSPFTIANSRLDGVGNVAVKVELQNGCVGWGEAPVLPGVTAEDQDGALAKGKEVCDVVMSYGGDGRGMTLGMVLEEVGRVLPGHRFASVRAGFEMALIDAAANSISAPLYQLFGGVSNAITTDITIPIVSPAEAAELASKYRKEGFKTLKLKVGKNLHTDIEVLRAIRAVHPDCSFILDANEGYKSSEAIEVLDKLNAMGVTPVLFEQPVHRDDWEGLGHVTQIAMDKYGVSVAADESCRGLDDVKRIVEGSLVNVINIKLAKLGVMGALEIIEFARASNLDLMIGGMVETRLAMGFAGHVAAGFGCFKFVDLDTPLLLAEDPVYGGYEGATYKFTNAKGHGGFLHWDCCNQSPNHFNVPRPNALLSVITETLLLLAEPSVIAAQTCNPLQLSSCVSAIMSSTPPSTLCCSKIKELEPCLCQYMKNLSLKRFVSSPNAKKVAAT